MVIKIFNNRKIEAEELPKKKKKRSETNEDDAAQKRKASVNLSVTSDL